MNKDVIIFYGAVILSLCFLANGCSSTGSNSSDAELLSSEYSNTVNLDIIGDIEFDDATAALIKKQKMPFAN